jgi:protein-tyrosine phosphatase
MPYKQVNEFLFIGDIFSLNNSELFHEVKSVISLCKLSQYFLAENTNHIIHDIEDNRDVNIITVAEKCYDHILQCEKKNIKVLVHCYAGKSRSASVVIYYLMRKYSLTFNKAYEKLITIKSDIQINDGFYKQLKALY